jgi:hypothetical protein
MRQMRRTLGLLAITLVVLALALAGCGRTSAAGQGLAGAQPGAKATTPTVPLASTQTLQKGPPATATPGSGGKTTTGGGHVSAGAVTVTLSSGHYGMGDAVTAFINNGLSTPISAADHQSACTMVGLQRNVNGAWQEVGECRTETVTRIMPINAGESVEQILGGNWPAGTYRIAFSYIGGSDDTAPSAGGNVFSVTFTIG